MKVPVTVAAEYIFAVRGVVNHPTMSGQFTVSQCSKEVEDFESSALPDTDKPPLSLTLFAKKCE